MATSISKSVPRSRLNIKYRTRIDGQVVPKELPLRLLIAGDFSGRAKVQGGDHVKPLPPLSQRIIYSIGKDSTLEGVLSRSRVSLPIPKALTIERTIALLGQATVRVEKTNVQDQNLLSIKSAVIEHAVELTAASADSKESRFVAADSQLYQGEVLALGSFPIQPVSSMPELPKGDPGGSSKTLGDTADVPSLRTSQTWQSVDDVELCGNVTAPVSPFGEPPNLLEVFDKAKVFFQFEDELAALLTGDSQDAFEFRVRIIIPKARARRGIQVAKMASFSPERVALSVPKIRQLLVVRWLLSQGRSMIGSNPALRSQVKAVLSVEEERLIACKSIAKLLTKEFEEKKQQAQKLFDKSASAEVQKENAQELLKLGEAFKETDLKKIERIVGSDWWAATTAANESLEGKDKENLTQGEKDVEAALKVALLPSPWEELIHAVKELGLDKFKIKGESK